MNDAYVHYLVQLHTKIEFLATDPKVRVHAAPSGWLHQL